MLCKIKREMTGEVISDSLNPGRLLEVKQSDCGQEIYTEWNEIPALNAEKEEEEERRRRKKKDGGRRRRNN